MQWYYVANDQQMGPLSDAAFQELVQKEIIGTDTLVWNESMTEWVPYGQLAGGQEAALAPAADAQGEEVATVDDAAAPERTQDALASGGNTPNADIMAHARDVLSGQWGLAIGICALYFVISIGISIIGALMGSVFPLAGNIVELFTMPPLLVGLAVFFIGLTRQQTELNTGMLFQGFNRYLTSVGAYLVMMLIITLCVFVAMLPMLLVTTIGAAQEQPALMAVGVLLFIVAMALPIYVSYMYAMTFFIIADDQEIGAMDALRRSKKMMAGRKWKFFCLSMRFLGWAFLAVFTLGIGWLWLGPYVAASYAQFYNDLQG